MRSHQKIKMALNVIVASVVFLPRCVQADPIDRIAWIAGCWRGEAAGRTFEEQWMSPSAGLMLGTGRTVANGRVTTYEQMRIEADGERLVFTSKPLGKPEDSFPALAGDDRKIVFENLAHPFPQRIIYQRAADGALAARIEGNRGDRILGIDFPMRRVSCDPPPA